MDRRHHVKCKAPNLAAHLTFGKMKKRGSYVVAFICFALAIAAGVHTRTGQGYSDPIVLPHETPANAVRLQRALDVRLTNKKTGRPQHYKWSLSISEGGAVEIECHEWVLIDLYGFSLPGFPKNSFRRIIPLDRSEEGVAEPYSFAISWRSSG